MSNAASSDWVHVTGLGWTNRRTGEVSDTPPEPVVTPTTSDMRAMMQAPTALTACPGCGKPSTTSHQALCKPAPEAPRRQRKSRSTRQRSPEDLERARLAREEVDRIKRTRDAIWMQINPVDATTADPEVMRKKPREISAEARAKETLLVRERVSGIGLPGSKLMVTQLYYDGMHQGEPGLRVSLWVDFMMSGYRFRSEGVALKGPEECREVAAALVAAADAYDRENGHG